MSDENKLPLIQDADLRDKIVLVRVDHNVVKKGIIHDPYRIDATIGTLYHIVARGGKLILMTHVGRPKDKKTGKININSNTSIAPIVEYLKNKLHIKIKTPVFKDVDGEGYPGIERTISHLIHDLRNDKIDALYLPNTRWFNGEEKGFDDADRFASQLADIADIFVNDAFGSWQPHASTWDIVKCLPSYAGFLMQKEIRNLVRIFDPCTPFIAVVAGSKFDTKVDSLYALTMKADTLVLGGVIYNAYLCAKYDIEIKGVDKEDVKKAAKFVDFTNNYPGKLLELPFVIESELRDKKSKGRYRVRDIRELKRGDKLNYILDIAPESFELEEVKELFHKAKTVFVNAVMGFTPYFNDGTIALDQLIDKNPESSKLYGGGDTMQELKRLLPGLYIMALDHPKYYIFTGGGSVLKAIEHGSITGLEPVKALIEKKN